VRAEGATNAPTPELDATPYPFDAKMLDKLFETHVIPFVEYAIYEVPVATKREPVQHISHKADGNVIPVHDIPFVEYATLYVPDPTATHI
jgi:hypothetical protein